MCYRTVFALYFALEGNVYSKGRLNRGFWCYEFRELIFGGAYFRNFEVFLELRAVIRTIIRSIVYVAYCVGRW